MYLALDPHFYETALRFFLPFANVFALEKPLARASSVDSDSISAVARAESLRDFAKTHSPFGKVFVPVDHYLGKSAFEAFESVLANAAFGDFVEDASNIVFQFLEAAIEPVSERPYFAETGIVADMMPHVLAILFAFFGRTSKRAISRDTIAVADVHEWQHIEYANAKKGVPTFAEINLKLSDADIPKNIVVRIGKGGGTNNKRVAIVDHRRHVLEVILPGSVVLSTPTTTAGKTDDAQWSQIQLNKDTTVQESWDMAWYWIVSHLLLGRFDRFLRMDQACDIVQITHDIQNRPRGATLHGPPDANDA